MRLTIRLLLALLIPLASAAASARDNLEVTDAYILESPPTARSNVGYMVVSNTGRHTYRLFAIDSDRFRRHEMHSMTDEGGVMKMRNERSLEVPAKGELRFVPGAYHLMLFDADPPLKAGETVTLLIQTDSGQSENVSFEVRPQPGMQDDAITDEDVPDEMPAVAPAAEPNPVN